MPEREAMVKSSRKDGGPRYVSKKCHSCYAYVPLDADICPSCKARLGKVGKHGMADRLTDWKAFIGFIFALLAFIIFIKFAFFK